MLQPVNLESQVLSAQNDRIRTLIVGAGVAGITLAQILRNQGSHPVVVERNSSAAATGYMIALMPIADPVFEELGLTNDYLQSSTPLNSFGFHSHKGRLIRRDNMADLFGRYGHYRGISRAKLLDVLSHGGCDIVYDTTVKNMQESVRDTRVTLSSNGALYNVSFDLIIIADGIHSSTRKIVMDDQPVPKVDTQWGGWVVWTSEDNEMTLAEELWGAGFFYGVYPVLGQLGVFLGGNRKDTQQGTARFVDQVREKLSCIDERMEKALTAVAGSPEAFYWSLADCRTSQWSFGRTILLGDAAAGFLPTAGIGAGMAMESAWVLAHLLQHANVQNVKGVLKAYEKLQRPRVESAQQASRQLAGIMFRQNNVLAAARDIIMKFISIDYALKPIRKLLTTRPEIAFLKNAAH